MSVTLIYRVHKWLAAVAAVATLAWFISGVLMAVPGRWLTLSPDLLLGSDAEARLEQTPAFADATATVGSAIAAVRAHVAKPLVVKGVRLRRLPGHLVYEVSTVAHGSHLVDAIDGTVFTVTSALAEQIAYQALGIRADMGAATIQRRADRDCYGPMPTVHIPVADGKGTIFCISLATAEVRYTDRLSRMARSIIAWHDFSVLRPPLTGNGPRALLVVFGVLGIFMSLAGMLILLDQWRRWWRGLTGSASLQSQNRQSTGFTDLG